MTIHSVPTSAVELLDLIDQTVVDAEAYAATAKAIVGVLVSKNGKIDRAALDAHQHLAHGMAWIATYAETLRQVAAWARRLQAQGQFTEVEQLLAKLLTAEYAAQLAGGLPMTQLETITMRLRLPSA
jgi:(2S)-methylsuccinyl-CoA dehydrogenase